MNQWPEEFGPQVTGEGIISQAAREVEYEYNLQPPTLGSLAEQAQRILDGLVSTYTRITEQQKQKLEDERQSLRAAQRAYKMALSHIVADLSQDRVEEAIEGEKQASRDGRTARPPLGFRPEEPQ